MENEHTIAGLIRKRAALAGQLEHAQMTARQLVIDLDHLDATIRLFQPDADLEAVKPKPYPPRNSAFRGEVSRLVLDALREAKAPMTTMEITKVVMAGRGLDCTDAKFTRTISKRVGACLRMLKRNNPVVSERGPSDVMVWSLEGRRAPSLAHASDCAVHNAPAMAAGACDCGAIKAGR